MSMQRITRAQLVETLKEIKGATFVTLHTATEPDMRKTGNPYIGRIVKTSVVNATINFNYAAAVERQQGREGVENPDFKPKPRPWGIREHGTPLITHKGNYYLEAKAETARNTQYHLIQPDGSRVAIDKSVIEPWLPEKRSNAEHQGVEKEIIVRDFLINSIEAITMKGQNYVVVP